MMRRSHCRLMVTTVDSEPGGGLRDSGGTPPGLVVISAKGIAMVMAVYRSFFADENCRLLNRVYGVIPCGEWRLERAMMLMMVRRMGGAPAAPEDDAGFVEWVAKLQVAVEGIGLAWTHACNTGASTSSTPGTLEPGPRNE